MRKLRSFLIGHYIKQSDGPEKVHKIVAEILDKIGNIIEEIEKMFVLSQIDHNYKFKYQFEKKLYQEKVNANTVLIV